MQKCTKGCKQEKTQHAQTVTILKTTITQNGLPCVYGPFVILFSYYIPPRPPPLPFCTSDYTSSKQNRKAESSTKGTRVAPTTEVTPRVRRPHVPFFDEYVPFFGDLHLTVFLAWHRKPVTCYYHYVLLCTTERSVKGRKAVQRKQVDLTTQATPVYVERIAGCYGSIK